ncbi:hypothetical protein B0I37DRAFT_380503 [Chaetomium sp. MPI-CAGE-AT-0009]|nr:hypothetical protein B0I37DRAFT_380503 [Chaetomium sp. MPI-CAGE-AT-0009]
MRCTIFLTWPFAPGKVIFLLCSGHTATGRHGFFSSSPGFTGDSPFGDPVLAFVPFGGGSVCDSSHYRPPQPPAPGVPASNELTRCHALFLLSLPHGRASPVFVYHPTPPDFYEGNVHDMADFALPRPAKICDLSGVRLKLSYKDGGIFFVFLD